MVSVAVIYHLRTNFARTADWTLPVASLKRYADQHCRGCLALREAYYLEKSSFLVSMRKHTRRVGMLTCR